MQINFSFYGIICLAMLLHINGSKSFSPNNAIKPLYLRPQPLRPYRTAWIPSETGAPGRDLTAHSCLPWSGRCGLKWTWALCGPTPCGCAWTRSGWRTKHCWAPSSVSSARSRWPSPSTFSRQTAPRRSWRGRRTRSCVYWMKSAPKAFLFSNVSPAFSSCFLTKCFEIDFEKNFFLTYRVSAQN